MLLKEPFSYLHRQIYETGLIRKKDEQFYQLLSDNIDHFVHDYKETQVVIEIKYPFYCERSDIHRHGSLK